MTDAVRQKFQPYIDRVTLECEKLSFSEKTKGIWSTPWIREYFSDLSLDEPNAHIAASLRSLLPLSNEERILCIGGGAGRLGRSIASIYPGVYVTEVDISIDMVTMANELAAAEGLDRRFVSLKARGQSLPFADNSFDYVIAYGCFRYMDVSEQEETLKEMRRVAKGGFMIAEPKERALIYSLKKHLKASSIVREKHMKMLRMSLFYMLYKEYERDESLKSLVKGQLSPGKTPVEVIAEAAGTFKGTLYELIAY